MAFELEFEKPLLDLERQIAHLKRLAVDQRLDVKAEIEPLEHRLTELRRDIYRDLTPMQRVQVARHPRRPYALDYIRSAFTDFVELKGDRLFRDDPAIVAGWARLDGRPVVVIGQQKGRDTKENLFRNFGMPPPEGYRKALRFMHTADRFGAPVITLIDTPGAYPGLGAEERGQADAIARNLEEMARLETPIVAAIIGEGGSGGALALGLADRVLMFENAVYSVISPEGCAAILWKGASQKERSYKLDDREIGYTAWVIDNPDDPVNASHWEVYTIQLNHPQSVRLVENPSNLTPRNGHRMVNGLLSLVAINIHLPFSFSISRARTCTKSRM